MKTQRTKLLTYLVIVAFVVMTMAVPVYAKTNWGLEGWRYDASTWIGGNLFTYFEGEFVPYRLDALTYDPSAEPISVQHDYQDDAGNFGIDGATGWFIGPVVGKSVPIDSITPIFTPGPTTFTVGAPIIITESNKYKIIKYTLELQPGFAEQLDELAAGEWTLYWKAHLSKTGSTNMTTGEPVVSGSSYWNGASLHTKTTVTGNSDVPIKTPPQSLVLSINVTKTANPVSLPEPGGTVTYTVTVENTSDVTLNLTSLVDDRFGNLADQNNANILNTTISLPQILDIGGSYTGTFTAPITGDPGYTHTNTVTATAYFRETPVTDSDDAVVTITDVPPTARLVKSADPVEIPETGGTVVYTFAVTNTSDESIMLTDLDDTLFASVSLSTVTWAGGFNPDTDWIAPDATVSGTFTKVFANGDYDAGDTIHNVATVYFIDDDESTGNATDDADVDVTDVLPLISISKVADPLTLPEPGGLFTYTFVVTNTGLVPVTVTSVTDSVIGAITLPADVYLLPGESTAEFTATYTHTDDGVYPNTVTAKAVDDDQNEATATADASVTVTDVLPTVTLTKTADPITRAAPGGVFVFTLTITNTSVEPVTVTELTDDYPLSAEALALIGQTIPAGGSISASYAVSLTEIGIYENTASVTVTDNEENTAADTDTEVVTVTLVEAPSILIDKQVANMTQGGGFGDMSTFDDGETAIFKIVVTNNGNVPLENVILSDSEVAGGTAIEFEGGAEAAFDATGKINLGTLDVGEQVILYYTYETVFADIARSTIYNTATVTGMMAATDNYPDGIEVTASDEAAIDVESIPLALSAIEITKQVFNETAEGTPADMATGFKGDDFVYIITITNTGDTLLSDVILTDDQAPIGGSVIRTSDQAELTWVDMDGKAGLAIGELEAGESISFTYRYTALESDEGDVIINVAMVDAVYKSTRDGYEDVPLADDALSTITIHETPPQTGEGGTNGTLIGLAMIMAAIVALFLRRRHNRSHMDI